MALFRPFIKLAHLRKFVMYPRPLLKKKYNQSFSVLKSKYLSQKVFESDYDENLVPEEWKTKLELPKPEFDWDFLLSEKNFEAIKNNIEQRKGVGNIQKIHDLWRAYQKEEEKIKKDLLMKEMEIEALDLPNMSHPKTVIGDESQAVQIRLEGKLKEFDFKPRNVSEIAGKGLQMLREDNLSFATGPKTYYLEDDLARLERALVSYTLDKLIEKGMEMVTVPDILHPGVIDRCGFKTSSDRSQVYHLHPECIPEACLAGTAEMSLAGYFMNETLSLDELPKMMAAVSRCFRAEAAENAKERGLYRVHHFTKVEMFGVTSNETGTESENLLNHFLDIECELFSDLGLHFRVLDMPSQELGASAHSKYDIEAWMYGKELWGEISSCSNCTDFQSRRLNIKYKLPDGELKHVHTVNGTACAVPRMITSILEQNQEKKRQLPIPDVLVPYMGGQKFLKAKKKSSSYTYIKTLRKV